MILGVLIQPNLKKHHEIRIFYKLSNEIESIILIRQTISKKSYKLTFRENFVREYKKSFCLYSFLSAIIVYDIPSYL